jgi:hypothetical protein
VVRGDGQIEATKLTKSLELFAEGVPAISADLSMVKYCSDRTFTVHTLWLSPNARRMLGVEMLQRRKSSW